MRPTSLYGLLALHLVSATTLTAQERFAPIRHLAKESVDADASQFALVGESATPANLVADDGRYDVSAWMDNRRPVTGTPRVTIWSEFEYDVSAGKFGGAAIQSLRFFAELYASGEEGSAVAKPPLLDDSSEEDAIHDFRVQILDHASGTWSDVSGLLVDAKVYTPGKRWRDTPYADRWSRPSPSAGAFPGPIDATKASGFVAAHVSSSGLVTLRVMKDIEITGARWDVTHVIDECHVEIDAGKGKVRYPVKAHHAKGDALAQQVFTMHGESGTPNALAARDQVYDVSYWQDSRPPPGSTAPPPHYEIWSELHFEFVPTTFPIADLGSLRLELEVYAAGWQPSGNATVPPGPPPTFDDASEEWRIHAAELQAWDWTANAWRKLRDWFDPGQYRPGTPGWRDAVYAARWSRPNARAGTYPGVLVHDVGGAARFLKKTPAGKHEMRVRLWKDVDTKTYELWDIVHAIDFARLTAFPRGIRSFGSACPGAGPRRAWGHASGVPDVQSGSPGFEFRLSDAGTARSAALLLGLSPRQPGLPLDALGAPGCALHVGFIGSVTGARSGATSFKFPAPLPKDGTLKGAKIYGQWLFDNRGKNRLGRSLSDGLEVVLQ